MKYTVAGEVYQSQIQEMSSFLFAASILGNLSHQYGLIDDLVGFLDFINVIDRRWVPLSNPASLAKSDFPSPSSHQDEDDNELTQIFTVDIDKQGKIPRNDSEFSLGLNRNDISVNDFSKWHHFGDLCDSGKIVIQTAQYTTVALLTLYLVYSSPFSLSVFVKAQKQGGK